MRHWIVVATIAAIGLFAPAMCFGEIIADSAADFGEAQGPGWFNGLYNATADADGTYATGDFQPFAGPDYAWNGSAWDFTGGDVPWTTIDANSGHPNGDNNGDVHYAVRRWVSDAEGDATVSYNLAKQNLNCGNGTTAYLYHNGTEISSATVEFGDGVGVNSDVAVTLASGDMLDLALSPLGTDATLNDGCDGSLFGFTVNQGDPPPPSDWQTAWQLGAIGRGWPLDGVGGGPEVDFVQEANVNERPGDPNSIPEAQMADDDYYFAGVYPDPPTGVGTVASDEVAMERAFAGADNRLTVHFNLPENLNPDDKFRFSFAAFNLQNDQGDSRYGTVVDANGVEIIPEVIYAQNAESGKPVGEVTTSAVFTAADVGFVGGAGADNTITLTGVNYNDSMGGNWMGMDYHHLEIMPIPEPGGLSMLLCGIFWAIPLVCWEQKRQKK